MRKVLDGLTFQSESIFLIKKASLALLVLEVIELVAGTIGQYYVQENFNLGNIEHSFFLLFPATSLILALTLWVPAHIFQKGNEREDEQKLTV